MYNKKYIVIKMNKYSPTINVMQMMRNALNTLNHRLLDHAERVSFLVVEMLKLENKYNDEEILEIAYIALLHDLGAFKTESDAILTNSDKVFAFEMMDTDSHAIFTYLCLRYFTLFSDKTNAVIYHHYKQEELQKSDCLYKDIASKIFLADRIDIILRTSSIKTPEAIFKVVGNNVFSQEDVLLLKECEEKNQSLTKAINGEFIPEIIKFYNTNKLSPEIAISLVEMLAYTIDFRSSHTLTHTLATIEISLELAKLHNLSEEELTKIYFGSLLHDIGKISTSLLVLEKNGKLDEVEFHYMKDHVALSERILTGNIDTDIVNIAARHHEKLNGNGYPHKLKEEDLTLSEKIVAIADIASALTGKRSYKDPFPKEKIIEIFDQMVEKNEICPKITKVFFDNYEDILDVVNVKSSQINIKYKKLGDEYNKLLEQQNKHIRK